VYLDALLTDKSVTRAAARVHITQPSMSLALTRIREYFADEILVTIAGREMVLTPLAQSLVGPVRNALLEIQAIAASATDFDPAKSNRKFSIMASTYAVDVLLQELPARLCRDAPGIQIEMQRLPLDSGRGQIKRADVDLLIAPEREILEEFPSERAWEDTIICIVWSHNHLVGQELSFERYMKMGHVCFYPDLHISEFLKQLGWVRKVEFVVAEISMIPAAIRGTNRIAAVPERLARLYAKQYSLRMVKPPIEFPLVTEFMQWHPYQDRDSALVWFRNCIKTIAVET